MNAKIIFILMLIISALSGCQQPTALPTSLPTSVPTETAGIDATTMPTIPQTREEPNDGKVFAFYLVADPQIAGPDLAKWELETLPLAEEPLISAEDILLYDWENHAFDVTEESYQHLINEIGGSVPVNGRPFVVVANGERIYAGAFWTLASSLSFDGVVIMDPAFASNVSIWLALGYPTEEFFTGEDPRCDPRIREALEEAGVRQ